MSATLIQSHIDALRRQIDSVYDAGSEAARCNLCRDIGNQVKFACDTLHDAKNELELLEAALSKEAKK